MTNKAMGGSCPDYFRVEEFLSEEYGMNARVARIADGEGSFNFRADTRSTSAFVKVYRQGAVKKTQEACCNQSEIARTAGVPTASLIPSRSGRLVSNKNGLMLSVWEWINGTTNSTVDSQYAQEIGKTLGRLHKTFRELFGTTIDAPAVIRWNSKSTASLGAQIVELRAQALAGCGREGCQFDEVAVRTLDERLSDLEQLDNLRIGTRGLTAQVIHGDYAPPNLLLNNGCLAAVVDFGPPDPFLISYELGRISYFPPASPDPDRWYATASEVIRGYLSSGCAPRQDVVMAPRVAAIQLLTSLYGIREHFNGTGLFQEKLDDFWVARHETARLLVRDLPDLERELANIVETY